LVTFGSSPGGTLPSPVMRFLLSSLTFAFDLVQDGRQVVHRGEPAPNVADHACLVDDEGLAIEEGAAEDHGIVGGGHALVAVGEQPEADPQRGGEALVGRDVVGAQAQDLGPQGFERRPRALKVLQLLGSPGGEVLNIEGEDHLAPPGVVDQAHGAAGGSRQHEGRGPVSHAGPRCCCHRGRGPEKAEEQSQGCHRGVSRARVCRRPPPPAPVTGENPAHLRAGSPPSIIAKGGPQIHFPQPSTTGLAARSAGRPGGCGMACPPGPPGAAGCGASPAGCGAWGRRRWSPGPGETRASL